MTTLDNPNSAIDPSTVSVWPIALRYGGLVSLILIVIGLITHLAGITDPANPNTVSQIVNCLTYVIMIVGVVMVVKAHRDKDLGGNITIGRSMGVGTATSLIIGLISAAWIIIFMTLIYPDMAEAIKAGAMEKAQPGQEEMTEKMVDIFSNPFIVAIMVLFFTVLLGFITALIAGAIMKKDPVPTI